MTGVLLKRSNDNIYVGLKLGIRDQVNIDIDAYPTKLIGAYDLLENHSTSRNLHPKQRNSPTKDDKERRQPNTNMNGEDTNMHSMQFTPTDKGVPGVDGTIEA